MVLAIDIFSNATKKICIFFSLTFIFLPRSYIKGWLPRQHQSVLSVDDKALVKHLYPLAHETHEWADPLSSPVPVQGDEEDEEDSEEEDSDEEEGEKVQGVP